MAETDALFCISFYLGHLPVHIYFCTPLFRCIYNTKCNIERCTASDSVAEFVQLPLVAEAMHLAVVILTGKKAAIFACAVATEHSLVCVSSKIFLPFSIPALKISARIAKEVEHKQQV